MTNHGFLQAEKLGQYLASRHRINHIFSSDLQRAFLTAKQVWSGQRREHGKAVETLRIRKLPILRERDFGSFECMPASRADGAERDQQIRQQPDFQDVETRAAMARRTDQFLDEHLLPIVVDPLAKLSQTVAVVAHGMILVDLWKCLLKRFALNSVSLGPNVPAPLGPSFTLDKAATFSNTGYLHLSMSQRAARAKAAEITEALTPQPTGNAADELTSGSVTVLYDWTLVVHAINSRDHLRGVQRTGGGVGSSRYDPKQKSIDGFFKKG